MASAQYVIVGLGQTGLSFARFLARQGLTFSVTDSALEPPLLDEFQQAFPESKTYLGALDADVLANADYILLSPGVFLQDLPVAITADDPRLLGDIELFVRQATAPIIAITGTNGKSTVTHLVQAMLEQAGFSALMAGNVGTPVLDCLNTTTPDYYVLELSSAQLSVTRSLRAKVACVLNIAADHLDCHGDFAAYRQAKLSIFNQCDIAVYNADDAHITLPVVPQVIRFGQQADYHLATYHNEQYLMQGERRLLASRELGLTGQHNYYNALAAIAMVQALGVSVDDCVTVLRQFQGLAHRCQKVAEGDDILWVNDSKATNVGATVAAIQGLAPAVTGKIILLAGGLAKGADFSELSSVVKHYVRHVILSGQDARLIQQALTDSGVPLHFANDMNAMVVMAKQLAQSGDAVLLAPACASWDQFKNFQARGDAFIAAVNRVV